MSTTDDRLAELRRQLTETSKRLAELEAIAVDALIAGKERDTAALAVKTRECRERVAVLGKAVQQLEHRLQLDAQAFMTRESMAVMSPLTKALDDSASKLALPPHVPDKPVQLEPETIKPKTTGKWFGNPKSSVGDRWNQRAR